MDSMNLTNWKTAFLSRPAPYLTDNGFPNPLCVRDRMSRDTQTSRLTFSRIRHSIVRDRVLEHRDSGGERTDHQDDHYVIGEKDNCLTEEYSNTLCNGPLKPNTVYV